MGTQFCFVLVVTTTSKMKLIAPVIGASMLVSAADLESGDQAVGALGSQAKTEAGYGYMYVRKGGKLHKLRYGCAYGRKGAGRHATCYRYKIGGGFCWTAGWRFAWPYGSPHAIYKWDYKRCTCLAQCKTFSPCK